MEKIDSFERVLAYLQEGKTIARQKEDTFILQKEGVIEYKKGSRFFFSLSLFEELFSHETFYLYQEKFLEIDEQKDEEYYRHYQK